MIDYATEIIENAFYYLEKNLGVKLSLKQISEEYTTFIMIYVEYPKTYKIPTGKIEKFTCNIDHFTDKKKMLELPYIHLMPQASKLRELDDRQCAIIAFAYWFYIYGCKYCGLRGK